LPEADLNVGEEWESVFIGLKPFFTRNSRRMRPRTGEVGKRGLLADFAVGF